MVTHWMVETETWKSRPRVARATATIVVSRMAMIDPRTTTIAMREISGVMTEDVAVRRGKAAPLERILHNTQRYGSVKEFVAKLASMGLAEEAFDRLRRIAFEGEHIEKMAALGADANYLPA